MDSKRIRDQPGLIAVGLRIERSTVERYRAAFGRRWRIQLALDIDRHLPLPAQIEQKAFMDDLWEGPSGDFSKTDLMPA
jgi:hypothetical protein